MGALALTRHELSTLSRRQRTKGGRDHTFISPSFKCHSFSSLIVTVTVLNGGDFECIRGIQMEVTTQLCMEDKTGLLSIWFVPRNGIMHALFTLGYVLYDF